MYTYPNSDLHILSGCPLEPSYVNTIYFDSRSDQADYFSTLTKYSFEKYTFLRDRRVIKVERPVGDLYDCNYIMFRNTSYSSRWFYAFITNVEYVNDRTSYISFEIDVMQTWFFDYDLQNVFVDREHSETDEYFEHTIPENLGYGENIVVSSNLENENAFLPDAAIYIASEAPGGGAGRIAQKAYGQYFPLYTRTTSIDADTKLPNRDTWLQDFNTFLETGKQDAVVSVYSIPRFMCREFPTGNTAPAVPPDDIAEYDFNIRKNLTTIGSYKPRNKKLFCYPYNFLRMVNNAGSAIDYRFEDFSTDVCNFKAYGTAVPNPIVVIVPRYYLGYDELFDCSLSLNGYPPIPYIGDVYTAYMAVNKNSLELAKAIPYMNGTVALQNMGVDALTNAANTILTDIPNAVKTAGVSLVDTGINVITQGISYEANREKLRNTVVNQAQIVEKTQLAQQQDLQQVPATIGGLSQSANAMVGADRLRPIAYSMGIKPEYAATIDNFFDRYGYKCNLMKIPNRNVRPHWTYTKTVGCTITARCPADAENAICKIYDSGITFWRYGDEVGNYSLDNTV